MKKVFVVSFTSHATNEKAGNVAQALEAFFRLCAALGLATFKDISDVSNSSLNGDACLPRFATLTNRERQILKLLAEGDTAPEIALDLNLSVKTVEAHKFNLMRKLDIHKKAHLVQYAIQNDIIDFQDLASLRPPAAS
jgi:DNA-binding NarL/FixJ family response regulator